MQETSLKGLIQGLSPEQPGVIEGKVMGTSPLSVTLVNDTKMCLSANSLVVPQHLTSYTVGATFKVSATGDTTTVEDHYHKLDNFQLNKGSITIDNSLKTGDVVYLLQFNGGKKFYILDRKGE